MDNRKILCVDDEESVLSALRRTLHRADYNVMVASGGAEAIEVMQKNKISLVISDMRMPNMNGAQFLKVVTERWPETVQILLTAYSELDVVEQVKQDANIFFQISKPWDNDELVDVVRRGLEK